MDATRRHEISEIITFQEEMDRNEAIENQSSTIGQAVTEMWEGLSCMTHKTLQCLKRIDSHGLVNGVNPTSVCREMKKWSKEAEDIDMVWEGTDGLTYRVRVKQVKSHASFMVESYEKRTGSRVI